MLQKCQQMFGVEQQTPSMLLGEWSLFNHQEQKSLLFPETQLPGLIAVLEHTLTPPYAAGGKHRKRFRRLKGFRVLIMAQNKRRASSLQILHTSTEELHICKCSWKLKRKGGWVTARRGATRPVMCRFNRGTRGTNLPGGLSHRQGSPGSRDPRRGSAQSGSCGELRCAEMSDGTWTHQQRGKRTPHAWQCQLSSPCVSSCHLRSTGDAQIIRAPPESAGGSCWTRFLETGLITEVTLARL